MAGLQEQREQIAQAVTALSAQVSPTDDHTTVWGAMFDLGLAWVNYPVGRGGLGLDSVLAEEGDAAVVAAGFTPPNPRENSIGYGMAAPTLAAYGTPAQIEILKQIYTQEILICQLFSEPGAGSDLAAVATKAVREDPQDPASDWLVTGQKVWNSLAHRADMGILVARTDTSVPKHQGLSYFLLNMHDPGVEVRPLRQITGEAEFNEVYLTNVRVPDAHRIGEIGQGWQVSTTTLNNERQSIGRSQPPESGMIGLLTATWRDHPELRDARQHDELMRLWVAAEAFRTMNLRQSEKVAAGQPGPESSAAKIAFAELNQAISGLDLRLRQGDALRYDSWEMTRPERNDMYGRGPGFRYLRAKGNSIEGGTTEIMRNIVAERVLGLPGEHRVDKDVAFKDLPT